MTEINNEIKGKIDEIVEKMTLKEKAAMIHGNGLFRTEGVERFGIPPLKMSDGPMGVRREFPNDNWNAINNSDDYVTYLPSNTALAATWNTDLAYKSGQVLGEEARGRGKDVILAPGINIMRSPVCGRNFEYFSEDPYLISKLAVPFIKGVQENDVAACVKHFALNNQETQRLEVNVEVDERTLREIYLPGFNAAIKEGHSYTIMSAYNRFRGDHCSENEYLLKGILKGEWKYDGVVISDWGAVHRTYEAANNGLDIEMSVTDNFDDYFLADPLIKAIEEGKIDEAVVDDKVRRILTLMYKINIFSEDRYQGTYNTPEHRNRTLEVARESIVLLKNDDKKLPLNKKSLKTLTVIGENADRIHSLGGGSAEIKALYEISPLLGLSMKLGGNTKINYVKGYSSDKDADNKELLAEAVKAAEASESVIIFGGLNHDYDTEGLDRKDIKLPYGQDELINKVLDANKNTIVVMIGGSPVEMGQWIDKAPAVVQSWYAGMEGGFALAEVLLGDVNPSGKLPVTFPQTLEDSPAHKFGEFPGDKDVNYKEGIFVGYRYFESYEVEPLFSFGHGLSYTGFDYSNLTIECNPKEDDVEVKAKFTITNIGDAPGAEVVQLYVKDKEASVVRPLKELKAFTKVNLQPKEKAEIVLSLDKASFAFFNEKESSWVCEKGEFEILIGSSSKDIRLKESTTVDKTLKYK